MKNNIVLLIFTLQIYRKNKKISNKSRLFYIKNTSLFYFIKKVFHLFEAIHLERTTGHSIL